MKKLLLSMFAALWVLVAAASDHLPFFVNFSSKSYGAFEPGNADRQFDFNEETGRYETTVEYDIEQPDKFMRFYQRDGDKIKLWNPLVWTRLPMLDNKEYELLVEEDRSSPLQITAFYGDVTASKLSISTVPGDTILYLRQIVEKEYIPERIYLWGSDEGGFNTHVFTVMEPSPEDPCFFSVDFEMPTWYFDPKGVLADFAADAFVFYLSTSGKAKEGTQFKAYLPYDTGDPAFSHISLSPGETFSTILQTAPQESSALSCHTPGLMHLTFDYRTYEFTATMLEGMNCVTLFFSGIDTYVHNKYINVVCNGEDVPLFTNPQKIWYDTEGLSLSVIPKDGYAIQMESLDEEGAYELSMTDGSYALETNESGLSFLVTIGKEEESGVRKTAGEESVTVYDLKGVPVAAGDPDEIWRNLSPGVYVLGGNLIIKK